MGREDLLVAGVQGLLLLRLLLLILSIGIISGLGEREGDGRRLMLGASAGECPIGWHVRVDLVDVVVLL